MKKNYSNFFRKLIAALFYLFVFALPWQTKFIWFPADSNFKEISLYASQLILILVLVLFFIYKIKNKEFVERIPEIWYFLAGLELFVFFSFFFAPDKALAFYRYALFLIVLGLFYLLREGTGFKNYEESLINKTKVIYSFLFSIFLQALLGVYQFLSQSTFACKYLGLATHDPQNLGVAVIETSTGRWLRAYGGLDHPNILGGVLAIALILAAYFLAKKKMLNSRREIWESIFLFVFYFSALFALLFTFSRAAWLSFAIGLIILLITLIKEKDRWILGRYLALVFFSIVLGFIALFPYQELLQTRIMVNSRLEEKSISERQEYLLQAETVLKTNWLFGVGVGNYTVALKDQEVIKRPAWDYQPVHNSLILLWAETGCFSLIFFLGFLICLIKKDRREIFSWAIFGVVIILMLFDHWLISLPFGVVFLFLVLGLI